MIPISRQDDLLVIILFFLWPGLWPDVSHHHSHTHSYVTYLKSFPFHSEVGFEFIIVVHGYNIRHQTLLDETFYRK